MCGDERNWFRRKSENGGIFEVNAQNYKKLDDDVVQLCKIWLINIKTIRNKMSLRYFWVLIHDQEFAFKETVSQDCGISEVMKIFKRVPCSQMSMIWQRMEY